jgi:uncharacterized membrane protein YuzA (DUF378 family)
MNFEYITALMVLLALYALGICFMKRIKRIELFNFIFLALVFVPYVILVNKVYRDVGFDDWNFRNTLPVANVSPFMFTSMLILPCLPKKLRKYHFLLISLLSVGMLFSTVLGCVYNAVINYKFHFHFMLDYLSHMVLSLFGIYLIRSKQAVPSVKNSLISGSVIVGAAFVMMILNLIFDTAFFGLSLRGKHNIYNNVLTESSYLSALLYFIGLCGVLCLGFFASRLFAKEKYQIK